MSLSLNYVIRIFATCARKIFAMWKDRASLQRGSGLRTVDIFAPYWPLYKKISARPPPLEKVLGAPLHRYRVPVSEKDGAVVSIEPPFMYNGAGTADKTAVCMYALCRVCNMLHSSSARTVFEHLNTACEQTLRSRPCSYGQWTDLDFYKVQYYFVCRQ